MSLGGIEGEGYSLFGKPYPRWVNSQKRPGHTPQELPKSVFEALWPVLTLQQLLLSPNLIWLGISILMYTLCPYDIEQAKKKGFSLDWISVRLMLNVGVTLAYCTYWHVALYVQRRASRKFNGKPEDGPAPTRLFHNIWYTLLGAIQWSLWECGFIYLWATGKLPYVSDSELLSGDRSRLITFLAMVVLTPVIREFHFYWAHRLLHFRVIYKHVHSLHHRNVSPDPFSGLCMHPVEHLYYYATVWPSLVALVVPTASCPLLELSPFLLLWNGMHAVISPAAGHSGWEDHWQSDQFHYLHHAKFECNYGGGGLPFDKVFGTFADRIEPKRHEEEGEEVRGSNNGDQAGSSKLLSRGRSQQNAPSAVSSTHRASSSRRKSKSSTALQPVQSDAALPAPSTSPQKTVNDDRQVTLFSLEAFESALPASHESALYFVATGLMAFTLGYAICGPETDSLVQFLRSAKIGPLSLLGLLISVGPIMAGVVLSLVFGDSLPMSWPFHRKEAMIGAKGLHLLAGLAFTVLPVYVFTSALVA